jgi:7,8-dihydropterin-6-yl-methyl-4-(beta-D-ribofuranosyl)aminobenzene 5'-phosphate synthase
MNAPRQSSRREVLKLSVASAISTALAVAYPVAARAADVHTAPTEAFKLAPSVPIHPEASMDGALSGTVHLKEVDEVRVTTLLDNFTDVNLASTEVVKRAATTPDIFLKPMLRAEHGFATLIETKSSSGTKRILLDTGSSPAAMVENADLVGVDFSRLDGVVLSHNHSDHTRGAAQLFGRLGPQRVPFVAHPYALLDHRIAMPTMMVPMPALSRDTLRSANVDMIEATGPSLLAGDSLLVSGEVPRTTSFEAGLPSNQVKLDGQWQADPLVRDDQAVAVNLRGKGLVIVEGCAHAGVVNSIRYLQTITGIQTVYAVIGGLHLQSPQAITPTVAAIQAIGPKYVVPMHCTGYVAVHQFMQAMPEAFIFNAVGTTLVFRSAADDSWEAQFAASHGHAPTDQDRADREWSQWFLAQYGHPPTDADWEAHYYETHR